MNIPLRAVEAAAAAAAAIEPPPIRYNEGARHPGATRGPDGSGGPRPPPVGQRGEGRGRGGGRGRGRGGQGRGGQGRGRGRGASRSRSQSVRRNPVLANDVNAPTQRHRYHATLVQLMEYKNKITYDADKTFTTTELLTLTPDDVKKWMAFRAFGLEDPSATDDPLNCRSTAIEYWKKAISYFMPNKHAPWTVDPQDPSKGTGNPTRSVDVNSLIRAVRRKETRHLGVPSNADRSFTREEFIQMVDLLSSDGHLINRLRHPAMLKFQFHLIGRSDDTAHVKKSFLSASSQFPGYLVVKMRWSKNVREERDCPYQIILGSFNSKFCVLLSLSLFLEKWIQDGEGAVSQWLFAKGTTDASHRPIKDQDNEANSCKSIYCRALKKAFTSDSFEPNSNEKGSLGSHSVKKFAISEPARTGIINDHIDYRARFKAKRMQNTYKDTQLDFPDVNCAMRLCIGGVCLYKVKGGLGLTDQWIANEIAPSITSVFGPKVGAVLGKVLLWACFEATVVDQVAPDIRHNVIAKLITKNTGLPDGENPIERVQVLPSEVDGCVSLDEAPNEEGIEPGDNGAATALARNNVQWRAQMVTKVADVRAKVTHLQQHQISQFALLLRRQKRLEEMVRQLLLAPARVITRSSSSRISGGRRIIQGDTTNHSGDIRHAILHRCPRTLPILWDEYANGIDGNKPASLFTRRERGGSNKYKYSRRLIVWGCLKRLIRGGCTVGTACNRITAVYGNVSVTKLINRMRHDERNGGHANLRV